jgi:hypothetical protein
MPPIEKPTTQRPFFDSIGQSEKNSVRANVFRFALELGHRVMMSALRICAGSRHHAFVRQPCQRVALIPAKPASRSGAALGQCGCRTTSLAPTKV